MLKAEIRVSNHLQAEKAELHIFAIIVRRREQTGMGLL